MNSLQVRSHRITFRVGAISARLSLVLLLIFALLCGGLWTIRDYYVGVPEGQTAHYVGRTACIECHQQEARLFSGSHHDLAMGHATESSVLGDFANATLQHHGITSRMYRDGSRFMINTEGPSGTMQDFEIKYVFGVEPLQQYMVEFDRDPAAPEDELPRIQVLRVSWDTVKKQWFYLDPPDVDEKLAPDDPLHWTGITQRWNTMCADCHSTNLRVNYDIDQQRYHTTFSEIDVSCEACHGPGSLHVELAGATSMFWDRRLGYGLTRLKSESNIPQIEVCAPCHSRRGKLANEFTPGDSYCDYFEPSTLRSGLYHDDGQILDEVYVYGSFVQSKMFHKGIRCTDCHDPHSLRLKAEGNQVCTSCHQHPAGKYDNPSHHKHVPGKPGSACVDCHMPSRTYMEVDGRRDHSLRIPRPDLSVSLGTPNACTGCHLNLDAVSENSRHELVEYADWQRLAQQGVEDVVAEIARADRWCDDACRKWYGDPSRFEPHFAEALAGFRKGKLDDAERLASIAKDELKFSAIARATALEELSTSNDPRGLSSSVAASQDALDDTSPVVRAAAIRALAGLAYREGGTEKLFKLLSRKLDDPIRIVRLAAARVLITTGAYRLFDGTGKQRFLDVVDELESGLTALSDRSGAHMDWALICESLGRYEKAIQSYQRAIAVEPGTVGPRSNLASLLENILRAEESAAGSNVSLQAKERWQKTARVITELRTAELPLLERDAQLLPEDAGIQYRLGLSYYLNNRPIDAREKLRRATELSPENTEFSTALKLLDDAIEAQDKASKQ